MRTLHEIIESVENGEIPTPMECFYAMLILYSLFRLSRKSFIELNYVKDELSGGLLKIFIDATANSFFNIYEDMLHSSLDSALKEAKKYFI